MSVSPQFLINQVPSFIGLAIVFFLFGLISIKLPFIKFLKPFNATVLGFIRITALIIGFLWLLSIEHDFGKLGSNTLFNQKGDDLYFFLQRALNEEPKILKYDPNSLKNLIFVQIESAAFEVIKQSIMPFTYNLTQQYETLIPIVEQPYSSWSTGGTLLTQCGIPQVVETIEWDFRGSDYVSYMKNYKCLPDYLKVLNYSLYYEITGSDVTMGLSAYRDHKGFSVFYRAENDLSLAKRTVDYLFPLMKEKKQKYNQNSVAWIVTQDTHIPFHIPSWCTPSPYANTAFEKAFSCLDYSIKIIVDKFMELKMYEDSILILFSDHLPYAKKVKDEYNTLFLIFPGIPKKNMNITREMTYYDFAHTILHLVGITDYSPGFPFGNNIYD